MKRNLNGKEQSGGLKMASRKVVSSEVSRGTRVKPAGIVQRLLALVLVAAMVVTSGGWSVLAEESTAAETEESIGASAENSVATDMDDISEQSIYGYSATSSEEDTDDYFYSLDGIVSNNVSDNSYTVYGSRVKSYLTENEDGSYTRVECISTIGVVVETYSSDYELIESITIEAELSIFGGFYAGEDYNFLVFGQENTEDSDECEVVRVIKYDKDWNRISHCSIYGANTTYPFAFGSLRMVETDGILYIHTCHTMYEASDGKHHQSNMTFVISEDSMTELQSYYIVDYGYVSHSFNQFIQTDGNYVYRVDHGDGTRRAVFITRCSADGSKTGASYMSALSICGGTGVNETGVSVGGFELSADNCLIVGNSVDQSDADTYSAYGQRNIFLTVTDKDLNDTNIVWLTDYTSDDGITPRTPQLVKLSDDEFLIMWDEYNSSFGVVTVKAVTIDGNGNLTSDIIAMQARLSDCQPIMTSDGLVKWYVTDGTTATMYAIDPYDLFSYTYLNPSVSNTASGVQVNWTASGGLDSYDIYRKTANGDYVLVQSATETSWLDTSVESGVSYTYKICANSTDGRQAWTEEMTISYVSVPKVSDVSNVSGGIQITWNAVIGATNYYIYYKKSTTGSYTSVSVEAGEGEVLSYKLSAITANTTYDIFVKAYLNDCYSVASDTNSILYLRAPSVSITAQETGIGLSWSTVTGAEGYYIYRKAADGDYSFVQTTAELSWTDTGVSNNSSYSYQVYAYCGDTVSGASTEKTITYLNAPVLISVENGSSGVQITWNAVEGAEKYYIYYKTSEATRYTSKAVTADEENTQSVTIAATSGNTYECYVEAYVGGDMSAASDILSVYYLTRPALSLSNLDNGIQLTWPTISGAEGYNIYKKVSDSEYTLVQTTTETSWVDTQVSINTDYIYQIYAYSGETLSAGSTEKSLTYLIAPEITDVENASGGFKITWNTVEGAERYYIYYKTSASTFYSTKYVTAGGDSTQSVTVSATSGNTYDFYMKTYAEGGYSNVSDTKSIYYLARPVVTLSSQKSGIQLSWSTITGADSYQIYRKTGDGVYTLVQTVTDASWLDETVEGGASYTYQVYSYSDGISSYGSAEKTLFYIPTPEIMETSNSGNYVQVTWETVEGAERYCVFYKLSTATSYYYTYVTAEDSDTQSAKFYVSASGGIYEVFVMAYASSTYSLESDTVSHLFLKAPTVSLSTDAGGNQLSWSAVTGAESYAVYRKTVDSEYTLLGTTSGTAWTDADIENGVTYTYQVYSYADGTYSDGSTEQSSGRTLISDCTITLSTSSYTYNGSAKEPTVTVKKGSSSLTKGTHYTVSYSDNVNAGTATVTITGIGAYVGTATKTFTINKASQTLTATIDSSSVTYGGTTEISASGTGTITYVSEDTSVATVSADGVVTGVGVGSTKITVTAFGDANYNEASKTIYVSVVAASISTTTVTLSESSFTYDGTAKTPTVTVEYGSSTLTKDTDYTVSYSNNTSAGTATITITGKGNYTGTETKTFTINKASQTVTASISNSTITVGTTTTITANGKGTITYSSGNTSVAKVSNSGVVTGVSAGTATITVSASGNSNYNADTATVIITVEVKQEEDGEEPETEDPDTENSGSESSSSESTGTESSGTGGSGAGSSESGSSGTDTSTTNKISACTITLSKSSYTYDGTAKKPSVTVKYGSKTLTKGTDYTVTYSNNTNAGTATVKITGKGSYTGSVSKTFTINPKSLSSCQMVFSKAGVITETRMESYLILLDGDTILEEYEDYRIWSLSYDYEYDDSLNDIIVSDVTVSVEGFGNYTGDVSFNLDPITAKTVLKSATKTSTGIKLTWQKETGAVGYQIYRKMGSGSYSLVKTITKNSTTSWTDTSIEDYKQYTYYVRAYTVNSSGKVYATKSSTKTVSTYLTTPTIKSVSNTSTGVKLTWSKVSGAAKYQIWRKTSSGSWTNLGTTTSTSYSDKTAKSGTTYSYRLRCVKSNGTTATSLYSSSKSIRRLSAGKVSSLTNTSSGITVKWSKVTGASGYYIYRKAGSGSYKQIDYVTGASTVSYTNKTTGTYKVTNGTTYTYYVIPYYKSGSTIMKGTYSNTKTTVRMTAVSISSVKNASSKSLTVKYSKNSKATGYQIQYSTSSSFASGSKTKTVTVSGASTVSKTIGSLTKSKKYYVRIRAYKTVSSTKYYSAWSSKKSVTISK